MSSTYVINKNYYMKMFKFLIFNILFTFFLFSSETNFKQELHNIYSDKFYNNVTNYSNIPKEKTDRIKKDINLIYPLYLQNKNLYNLFTKNTKSKQVIKELNELKAFFASLNYYIFNIPNKKLALKLLEKELKDITKLANSSTEMLQYILSLSYYDNTYKLYNNTNSSFKTEFKTIIKKYPPPTIKLFFEKLDFEHAKEFNLIKSVINKKETSNPHEIYFRKQVLKYAKKYSDLHYNMYKKALKSNSETELKKYNLYLEKESKNFFTFWEKLKLIFYTMLYKLLSLFGIYPENNYLAEHLAKLTIAIGIPDYSYIYKKNISMIKEYNKIINAKY